MSRPRTLKGHCTHCDGLLEFPVESTGLTTECPLCGKTTELMLARPVEEPTIPRKTIVWTLVAVIVLAGGLVGAIVALKRAQRWASRQKPGSATVTTAKQTVAQAPTAEDVISKSGFRASFVTLEKIPGGSLVYAVGSITNASARQRFGVKVELDLVDSGGQKVGSATDYQAVMEPKGQWQFRALIVDPKAVVAARLVRVTEQQ